MSFPFEARFTSEFIRDLERLDASVRQRILRAVREKLLRDPYGHSKKLVGIEPPGVCRFRVGDYRVRFDVDDRILILRRVAHRREIYE